MARKRQLMEETLTIVTLKNVDLSYKIIAKKVSSQSKGTQKLEEIGRKQSDTKTQLKDKFLLTAYMLSSSQDNSFKNSLIVVIVSKSQFQL